MNSVELLIQSVLIHYIVARKDNQFREALMASDFIIPDGVGIILATRVLSGKKICKNCRL